MNKSIIKIVTMLFVVITGFMSPSPATAAEAKSKVSIIDIVVEPLRCWVIYCEDHGNPGEPE
ncbi:MAG: hypothetical protein CL577_08870 [Alteromonadaceae bacterium]|jgi:hypothetical protein|uniref:hypothetical protein n=1 Tax=Rheinheimera aquimaris TaxID=412437 RepID=UPI000C394388|nr:hypothetical protein [Rheinheimera aquimaris]MBJ92690.1 hypothetical protein [Alteromonadaceae bacterium]|tara:strand:+ start:857 stop:1042 length:186 start_codon:yes stop_codon:yes gene_type:complete